MENSKNPQNNQEFKKKERPEKDRDYSQEISVLEERLKNLKNSLQVWDKKKS